MATHDIMNADAFTGDEASRAKEYWANIPFESYTVRQPWSDFMAERVLGFGARRVLELGCNAGKNLAALAERDAGLFVAGIDVNQDAVGHAVRSGLRAVPGDESLLQIIPDNAFDVAFTISVLDHVPDPGPILAELGRVSSSAVLLLEPWMGEPGKVLRHTDPGTGEQVEATPYSYSWDYHELVETYLPGWTLDVEAYPLPTKLGRYYHLYTVRAPALADADVPVVSANAAVPFDWACQRVAGAKGFDQARTVLELGGGDLRRSLALALRYPDKHFIASDLSIDRVAVAALPERPPNLEFREIDARATDIERGSIDFIFSIALMEHVAELADCLRDLHRVLRPGGVYYYIQAPFWSCAQGHHFRHWDDETFALLPLYGHLTMTRAAMEDHLRSLPDVPFDIDECLQRVYDRDDLSRLTRDETRRIVEASPFRLVEWEDYDDRRHDPAAAAVAAEVLGERVRPEELRICGAYVTLRKRRPRQG